MGLGQVQGLLARLYTDPALRARFRADPRGVGTEFGLDAEETARLVRLSAREVGRFAGTLVAKRRNEVEKLLPRTLGALGPERFAAHFREFAAGYVPTGVKKHRDDALRFVAFLEASARPGPAWTLDLARLEAAMLAARDPSRRWVGRRFRFAPDDLIHAVPAPAERPTFALWVRLSRRGRLHNICLSVPRWLCFRRVGTAHHREPKTVGGAHPTRADVPGLDTARRSPDHAGRT